jgi:DeoR family transcriptional regulator, fructose operon transcriptional repressor
LLEKGIQTYMIGGYAKPKTKALIGRGALESLEQYHFDKCFLGVNGIHLEFGYTTPDQEEALIKQKAMRMSRESFVLADSSKFSEVSFAKIANIDELTIITDALDNESFNKFESKTSIKVVTS